MDISEKKTFSRKRFSSQLLSAPEKVTERVEQLRKENLRLKAQCADKVGIFGIWVWVSFF